MKIALENFAIMAGDGFSAPVVLFVTVADARDIASLAPHGHDLLGGDDVLGPTFSHWDATVNDFFSDWSSAYLATEDYAELE